MAIQLTINYWAVLVSALICMVLGSLWYSKLLFGNIWIKLAGMDEKKMAEVKKKGMALTYILAFIAVLVMSYVFANFVQYTNAVTFVDGMLAGFFIWLGFVATIMLNSVLWEGKSVKLYFINILHYLILFLIIGGLLAVWK